MVHFLVFHIASIVAILYVARRTLAVYPDIPRRIKLWHYVFISFLVFMNVSGVSQASWTLGRLLEGEVIDRIGQHLIAFKELPPSLAAAIWAYVQIGKCTTTFLTLGVARLNRPCRALLIRLFPFLILAEGVSSCTSLRGSDGLGFVRGGATEYVVTFCIWCLVAWPYIFAYRFYRSAESDILFGDVNIEDPREHSPTA